MKSRRVALDGAARRRLYLFRHAAVDYVDENGAVVADPDQVPLNATGRRQAAAMCDMFANITIDRAICSGMPRARETACLVLGDRGLDVEDAPKIREIRAAAHERPSGIDVVDYVAFGHWSASESGSRFLGGERYADFYQRIASFMESLLSDPEWHNLAIFAHGGTNAAILGWTSGLGLTAFGVVDQSTCCVNVLDFDFDANDRRLVRKVIRAMNVTADDPAKSGRHSSDMEMLARQIKRLRT